MTPKKLLVLALGLAVIPAGCATPSGSAHTPAPEISAARWVAGPTPEVRTLLVSPAAIARIDAPGMSDAQLSIGAFFTRWDSPSGSIDQLALLVELVGDRPMDFISFQPSLLLEMDGTVIDRAPGVTGNSVSWDTTAEGRRARMVIPITPVELRALADADQVRGRVGLWAAFAFDAAARARLATVLEGMPADAQVDQPDLPRPRITAFRGTTD